MSHLAKAPGEEYSSLRPIFLRGITASICTPGDDQVWFKPLQSRKAEKRGKKCQDLLNSCIIPYQYDIVKPTEVLYGLTGLPD